jgi:hypothetical protein
MSKFNEREKAFEEKYRREQEKKFKIIARRNKLFGLWAAEKMGLEADEAKAYAKEIITADFQEPGSEDVLQRVLTDLQAKGIEISKHLLQRELERLYDVASRELADKD